MLKVSEEALEKLGELLSAQGGENSAIRVAVMGGVSNSSGLGLIVDESQHSDKLFSFGAIPLIIERNLLDYCQSITIEFKTGKGGTCGGNSGSGFIITPENPVNF